MKKKPPFVLSDDQKYCRAMLSQWVGGDHHLGEISECGPGILMPWSQDFATYDFDAMTRLVVLAHVHLVRVSVKAHGPRQIAIICHRRTAEGTMPQRHPSIEALLERFTNARGQTPPIRLSPNAESSKS